MTSAQAGPVDPDAAAPAVTSADAAAPAQAPAPARAPRRGLPRSAAPAVNQAAVNQAAADQAAASQAAAALPPQQDVAAAQATPLVASDVPRRRAGLSRSGATTPTSGASGTEPAAPVSSVSNTAPTKVSSADDSPTVTISFPASGSQPESNGRSPWRRWLLRGGMALVALIALAALVVVLARWLVSLDFMHDFLTTYPGETHLPEGAPIGLPAWLGWQHFFNAFFIVLIIRSGWQVRTQTRPPAMWVRKNVGPFATKNPPKRISLTLWSHLAFDALWFVNGLVFVVLLFATGQWMRVVPTSWEVFPNALSAALQYLSLNWPTENGWVNYNSLQVLAYCLTIFVAAPLAALTGIRMSGAWPATATRLNKIYPLELARAIHFPVMLYFVLFIIAHVTLVLATGALRNLNHMYGGQDAVNWTGFWIFIASLVVMIGAVFAARPAILAPIAQLMGKVGR